MIQDYSKKAYRNPFIRHHQKRKNKKYSYSYFFIILAVIFTVFLLLRSTTISQIEISGNVSVPKEELLQKIFSLTTKKQLYLFSQKYLPFFNSKDAEDILQDEFFLHEISITKKYPRSLFVQLQEEKPFIVIIEEDEAYYIDVEGKIMGKAISREVQKETILNYDILRHKIFYNNIPLIYSLQNTKLINTNTTNNMLFNNVKTLIENIKKISININYYEIDENEKYISAFTADGWKIFFSLDEKNPLNAQVKKLQLILENQLKVGKIIEYIDLRFGEKVFYR